VVGAIPSQRCRVDPACAYPSIDVLDGKPACALCRHAAEHAEAYARAAVCVFRRIAPAPVRRHYVPPAPGPRSQVPGHRCSICGLPCGPTGLCRAHIDGWRKHNGHHPLDQITPAQYAARRKSSSAKSAQSVATRSLEVRHA
jgi:hypothetical protein